MLTRKPDESALDYHRRLVYGKLVDHTLSDVDYSELSQYMYGQQYSSDVARRMAYGSCRTLQLLDKERTESCDSKTIQSIDERLRSIAIERAKLQTEKIEYNRWVREQARDQLFEEKVLDAIRTHISPTDTPEYIEPVRSNRCGVLCISDMHFGKEFKIFGLDDTMLNEYSPEVFYGRMEQIFCETIDIVRREGLSEIRVYNLGDSVDGFLRNKQLWTLRYGVIDSAIILGNYMGDWLRELSRYVRVVYAQTDGNHDELRLLDGQKGQHLCESAGKVLLNCIQLKNEDNPNMTILSNKTGFIFDTVCGYNVLGVHGEFKDSSTAIREFSDTFDTDISYLFSGHIHHTNVRNCGVRKGCIGVGSIIGIDDFSVHVRKVADATSTFVIFEDNKGKVAEHTFVLN